VDQQTVDFYRNNALAYALATRDISMADCYQRFERHVPAGARILDVGAGSGRDMRHFRQAGFRVEGIEACTELATEAARHSGAPVHVASVEYFVPSQPYDAIWANAVLLHLAPSSLASALGRLAAALKPEGLLFVSFRCGEEKFRHIDGRLYFGMDSERLNACAAGGGFATVEQWEEGDRVQNGASTLWVYAILKKQTAAKQQ
jgi:SAM-dependent methyltransferase